MTGRLTPPELAVQLTAEAMFKMRRDFPALRIQEAAALLAKAQIEELARMAHNIPPAEMAYRLGDGLIPVDSQGRPA